MITNKGNQILTKYMLGQAPEYAAYIAVGVGAKPISVSESDPSIPTKKSMDFEAFRVPVLSRGIVNDTIVIDLNAWSASSNLIVVTTSVNHGIRVGDIVDISFSASANASKNGTFTVTAITADTIEYSQTIGNSSWTTTTGDTATVTYVRDRIIFKAQLPPDQYYQMTEIALYPAANNQLALGYDSKLIAGFLPTDGWVYNDGSNNSISFITDNISDISGNVSSSTVGNLLFINSDNAIFQYSQRKARYESPRFLNRCLIIKGDMTSFSNDSMSISGSANYVTTADVSLNFSKNSPDDYIKLALSVVSPDLAGATSPNKVRLRIDFLDSTSGGKATATHLITSTSLASSRYQVVSKQIKDFTLSNNFSWARIDGIVIYVQTLNISNVYDGSYVVLDGMRIDNENTENTLYGMVAYSVMKNIYNDQIPIEKLENSQGYIEYRLGVSVY